MYINIYIFMYKYNYIRFAQEVKEATNLCFILKLATLLEEEFEMRVANLSPYQRKLTFLCKNCATNISKRLRKSHLYHPVSSPAVRPDVYTFAADAYNYSIQGNVSSNWIAVERHRSPVS